VPTSSARDCQPSQCDQAATPAVVSEVRQCFTICRPVHHSPLVISQAVTNTTATMASASKTLVRRVPELVQPPTAAPPDPLRLTAAAQQCARSSSSTSSRRISNNSPRSSADRPPKTPTRRAGSSQAIASAKHTSRTGHAAQTRLAAVVWASSSGAPTCGKNSSGSAVRHAARSRQFRSMGGR